MQYVFFILIGVLILVIWSIYNEKSIVKKLKNQLKSEWASIPEEEYSSEKLESLQSYYKSVKNDLLDVDDITWNDLDMDELYMLMNNTQSAMGEEYLYALLRQPCFSEEELKERNRLMNFFHSREDLRVKIQASLHQIGKLNHISVFEYSNRLGEEKAKSNLPHYIMAFGLILSVVLIFINPGAGGILTFLFFVNNTFRYFVEKAKIDKYLTVYSFILRLLNKSESIIRMDIPEIKMYMDAIKQDISLFQNFRRGAGILVSKKVSGSLMDAILDYIRMLTHIDLIKYNSMLSFFKENRIALNRIFANVGFLDSMIAAASFRDKLDYYCIPELTKSNRPSLSVNELYHPLIADPVPNSITENRSVLLTGSNASGKSTFIKTLAINAILSQTIDTSPSRGYKASYFVIYSSMALRDSIFRNESYYIVEIKSLKRILDRINKDIPMLCFIDEVLRGTNTQERIAASSRILVSLAKKNVLCFAATHDIELTHILENCYSNCHFQEHIVDQQILFDYKLYRGRATSRNAIKLLGLLGYSQDIIDAAEKAAEEFTVDGEWKKI